MNPITLYMVDNMLGGFVKIAGRICGGDVERFLDQYVARGFGELVVVSVGIFLAIWLARFLYRRGIFLRL